MPESRSPSRTLFAVGAACTALLLAGAGFRGVDAALSAAADGGIPTPDLGGLPVLLGNWSGRDLPLSAALVQAADVETHVHRTYASSRAGGSVSLFVGYGVRARDLVPHRPGVCYPAAGWRFESERPAEVPLPDGTTLPCSIYRFTRGGVDSREITVLNYYRINGVSFPDVSYLRMNAWARGRIRYVAQVQIACAGVTGDTAERYVREFARDAASAVNQLLPGAADGSR